MTAMKQLLAYFSLAVTVFLTGLFTVPIQAQESSQYKFEIESVELFNNPVDMDPLQDGTALNSGNLVRVNIRCDSVPEWGDNVYFSLPGEHLGNLGIIRFLNDEWYYPRIGVVQSFDLVVGHEYAVSESTNVILEIEYSYGERLECPLPDINAGPRSLYKGVDFRCEASQSSTWEPTINLGYGGMVKVSPADCFPGQLTDVNESENFGYLDCYNNNRTLTLKSNDDDVTVTCELVKKYNGFHYFPISGQPLVTQTIKNPDFRLRSAQFVNSAGQPITNFLSGETVNFEAEVFARNSFLQSDDRYYNYNFSMNAYNVDVIDYSIQIDRKSFVNNIGKFVVPVTLFPEMASVDTFKVIADWVFSVPGNFDILSTNGQVFIGKPNSEVTLSYEAYDSPWDMVQLPKNTPLKAGNVIKLMANVNQLNVGPLDINGLEAFGSYASFKKLNGYGEIYFVIGDRFEVIGGKNLPLYATWDESVGGRYCKVQSDPVIISEVLPSADRYSAVELYTDIYDQSTTGGGCVFIESSTYLDYNENKKVTYRISPADRFEDGVLSAISNNTGILIVAADEPQIALPLKENNTSPFEMKVTAERYGRTDDGKVDKTREYYMLPSLQTFDVDFALKDIETKLVDAQDKPLTVFTPGETAYIMITVRDPNEEAVTIYLDDGWSDNGCEEYLETEILYQNEDEIQYGTRITKFNNGVAIKKVPIKFSEDMPHDMDHYHFSFYYKDKIIDDTVWFDYYSLDVARKSKQGQISVKADKSVVALGDKVKFTVTLSGNLPKGDVVSYGIESYTERYEILEEGYYISGEITIPSNWNGTTPLTQVIEKTVISEIDEDAVYEQFHLTSELKGSNNYLELYIDGDEWSIIPVFAPVTVRLASLPTPKPEVSISSSSLTVKEGTSGWIDVQLDAKAEKAMTVQVRITDGDVSKTMNAPFKVGEYSSRIAFTPTILKKNRFANISILPGTDYLLSFYDDDETGNNVLNYRAMIEVLSSVNSSVKYVKNGGSNDNDGSSFAKAYATIDEALRQVNDGGMIYVGGGTYPISKTLKVEDVSVYGGFTGTETIPDTTKRLLSGSDLWSFKHPTVITAAAYNAAVSEDKYIHHVTLGKRGLFNGCTLIGGKAPILGFDEWNETFWYGAASVETEDEFRSGSHELSQCIIEENEAEESGDILSIGRDCLMRDCLVQNNIGRYDFFNSVIDGCRIINNQAPFMPEDEDIHASMVYLFASVIRNTMIANNVMDNMENSVVYLTYDDIYSDYFIPSVMENCVVANNTGYTAVLLDASQINHSTVAHNLTYKEEGEAPVSPVLIRYSDEMIENSVITGNTENDLCDAVEGGYVAYSALEYPADDQYGNIDISSDSWFVYPTSFIGADSRRLSELLAADWSLIHGAPMIDAANGVSSPTLDMLGHPRINLAKNPDGVKNAAGMYPDMGAYETAKKSEINLTASNMTTSKSSVNPKEVITVGFTVSNTGTVTVNETVNTRFWLKNGDIREDIPAVTTRIDLNAGDTAVVPGISIQMPSVIDGEWTLWAEVNAGPSRPVNELDYADNQVSKSILVSTPEFGGDSIDIPPGEGQPGKPAPGENPNGTILQFMGTGFTVYAGVDYIPTSKKHEYKSRDAGGKQELVIPAGIDMSKVYLLVVNNTNQRITITIGPAEELYFRVYAANPLVLPNDRVTHIILNGNLLSNNNMNVTLSQKGGVEVVGKIVSVSSNGESATVSFNATGLPSGKDYILKCSSNGRYNTFDAEVSGILKPYIEGSLTGLPSFTPVPQLFSGVVRYKNSGDIETVAPTFILSVSGDATIGFTRNKMSSSVKFTGEGKVKNLLSKDESGNKPFLVNNLGNEDVVVVTLERMDEKGNYVLVDRELVSVLVSQDPNEISGPAGFGTDSYVMSGAEMPYTIRFENDPDSAFGPVKYIKVTHKLPEQLDIDSISLGNIMLADQVVDTLLTLGAGNTFYAPLESDSRYGCQVRIETAVDKSSRLVTWQLTAVDSENVPLTENTNSDLFALGLLQPNITPPEGDGHFEFKVNVRNDKSWVDSWINASVTIWFDRNDPIETNIWKNRISGAVPTAPKPNAPADNGQLSYTASTVSWLPSEAATHYDVKIWAEKDPEPVYPNKTGLTSTFYTVDLEMATPYCWQVTAWNQYDSAIGDVWRFTTTEPPIAPRLVSPTNQSENIPLNNLTLKIATVGTGVTNYRFQVATVSSFDPEHVIYTQETARTESTLPSNLLNAGKTYYWRALQITGEGVSLPTEPWTFKTVQGELSALLSSPTAPCQGGKVVMTVKNEGTASLDWTASIDRSDVKLSTAAGTLDKKDTASVIMTFPENTDYADKICRVTVTSPNALHSPIILEIKQSRSAGNSVSAGMISVLNASDVGKGVTEFTKKPSIRGIYTDAMNKSGKKASFKVMKGFANGDAAASFELTSNILLYNKKLLQSNYYKKGYGVDSFLKDGHQSDKTLALEYKGTTNIGKTNGWESLSGTMVVKAPMISEIFMQNNSADSGRIMGSGKSVIRGMYAGKKFPKVWIEYVKNNKIAKLTLKVDAKDSGCYKDSSGKAVCTDPQTGLSYLVVTGPKKLPAGMVSGGHYWLVIDNGSGLACERVIVKML